MRKEKARKSKHFRLADLSSCLSLWLTCLEKPVILLPSSCDFAHSPALTLRASGLLFC
jgi:hypothetical protein